MKNLQLNFLTTKKVLLGVLFAAAFTTSCEDAEKIDDLDLKEPTEGRTHFTLALSASPTGETKVYTQAHENVGSEITVDYTGVGFEMPSTRTARIFSSADGKYVYNLDYGGGRIYKFSVDGLQTYTQQFEKNVEFAMGTAYPRWTKASESSASIHYADGSNAVRVFDANDPTKFVRSDVQLNVMSVDLENLSFGAIENIAIPVSDNDLVPYTINVEGTDYDHYNYTNRVDSPVIAGDKIYYGLSKGAYSPENPCTGSGCPGAVYTNVETLVLDYPTLTNPKIIATDMAQGATNGYRTPVAYTDDLGDVYQIISVPDNNYDTHILKISNGDYDASYDFNLSDLLGFNVASNGWFYVGNGIGYVPYANTDLSDDWFNASLWSIARVDVYNKTVVNLNVPKDLWLTQYQNAVVKDGKFYMSITPTGVDGNVYIFDINSEDPNAFEKGAVLKNLAEGTFIGIY
ncbi:hypothetical protein [Flavicella sp.]|uniref:hypothetical protein n=1 Tax=Flavicella sp. TaxID=2957742 RepID=UPI0026381AEA|nr:hypothetical protein [Flavicella sp.]MDG1804746.1 hypothetical protein [Flavicella sp.]